MRPNSTELNYLRHACQELTKLVLFYSLQLLRAGSGLEQLVDKVNSPTPRSGTQCYLLFCTHNLHPEKMSAGEPLNIMGHQKVFGIVIFLFAAA